MWTHWLKRLNDRCPSCAVLLLTGVCRSGLEVSVLVRAVSRPWARCCRYWLQRLCDRCPGLFTPWLTGCVSMWPQVLVLLRVD